jgi:ABC-type antimicrobial peptide transport system permease subunit
MVTRAESVDAALAVTVRARQFQSALFGAFAVATLVLLGVGTFGTIAMNTASRAREIGVRMALGATTSAVRRMVLAESLAPVLVGLSIGGTAAWWTTGLLASLIYGVGPHNPQLWAMAAAFVLGTAMVAAWLPALRASRVDPLVVLRA